MEGVSFGTDGWRTTREDFTRARIRAVGQAVATFLTDEGLDAPVGICYDSREGSRAAAEELARVCCANGYDVRLADRDRPTPCLAHAIVERGLSGGLMVTASHNPPEYNGIKFIPSTGAPALPQVTDAIAERLAPPAPLPASDHGRIGEVDLAGPHADACLDRLDVDLSGLTVAYDAMYGSGRDTTDALLERAGARVQAQRTARDPTFGGTGPDPGPDTLPDLVDVVTSGAADLGVANDGDADRIALVTPERGVLNGHETYAVCYQGLLTRDGERPGPAVRTVSTTALIDRIANAHGESVHEVPVGFKWVAAAMAEHDALFGGEESGGYSIRGHVREKDGVLMALLAAALHHEEPLDDRLDRLTARFGAVDQGKTSVECPEGRVAAVMDAMAETVPGEIAGTPVVDRTTMDGFKLFLEDGSWVLVRPSGTEPVIRVYAEAATTDRVERLLDEGSTLVEGLV